MDSLFPITVAAEDLPDIPGLIYLPEYVSEPDEQALAAAIDQEAWNTAWERRRQPYGGSYGEGNDPLRPIPPWGLRLAERMFREGLAQRPFDQMLVNEYLPGQGIALHRDYEPFDRTVVALSLLAPCVMDFRHAQDGRQMPLLLERRSVLILRDEARYDWEHGIARRKSDVWKGFRIPRARRLSVTFRSYKQRG
jgi:alkylated DNA repair dioxygenase AlkB